MSKKEIELWPYQIELLHDTMLEELNRLSGAGIEDGRNKILWDQADQLAGKSDRCSDPLTVTVIEKRPIADAIMNEMYFNTRLLVEDGPHSMGDLGELARLYREIFNDGPNQSHHPKNESMWGK